MRGASTPADATMGKVRFFGVEMNALVAMQATYDVARTQRMLGNRMKVRLQRVPAELRVD